LAGWILRGWGASNLGFSLESGIALDEFPLLPTGLASFMQLSFVIKRFSPRVSRTGLFFCFLPFIPATVLFRLCSWDTQLELPGSSLARRPAPCERGSLRAASPPPSFYFPPGSTDFPWFLLAWAQAWRDRSGVALLLSHW
jgi:hypothetical protein